MAGLWEEFEDGDRGPVHTFRMITVNANEQIQPANTRMPAIIDRTKALEWLDATVADAINMLSTCSADQMSSYTVSSRVNNPGNNDPGLIEPMPPADQFGNYSLFD